MFNEITPDSFLPVFFIRAREHMTGPGDCQQIEESLLLNQGSCHLHDLLSSRFTVDHHKLPAQIPGQIQIGQIVVDIFV